MGIYCNHSILEKCKTNRDFLGKFYDSVCEKRPKTDVVYRPQTYHQWEDINWPGADLAKLYPDYEEGDYVYFGSLLDGLCERKMLINVRECSNEPQVWFNGKKAEITKHTASDSYDAHVTFKQGQNQLMVCVKAEKDMFSAKFLPLIPELRMSPDFYVYCSWQYIDAEGFRGQKGVRISRLYKKDEPTPSIDGIEWIYPVMPPQSSEKMFEFNKLCDKGIVAYSYTHVCGTINISHEAPITVFENGKEVYSADSGKFTKTYNTATSLLIRARKHNKWGFFAKTQGEHSLPFVEGADCPDLQWMWIGPFGNETDGKTEPYGPEINLQFKDPYSSIYGPLYWHFFRKNTMLLQTVLSNFYGHWFYPLMIGLKGMKAAAAKLGREKEIVSYFSAWMQLFTRHIDYGKYERIQNGSWSRFLTTGGRLDNLDSIGTIGINVAEYYMMSADREAKYLLQLLADSLSYKVPRFEDGTFHRIKTMWTDDTYMCLPFLVRLGVMTGEERYFDDILAQLRGFFKRMWMEEQELFSHIYFVEDKKPNRIPWGRGNGWVMLALSEVLLLLPKEYHGYEEILGYYKKFAAGVLKHRDSETLLWHQVINNQNSYIEASGSAMFITALARGVRNGWIDKSLEKTVEESWKALLYHCVDSEYNLHGVCMGSGCSKDENYYCNLKTITNDDHGIGIVLETCVEVMNMLGE